jgi:hypothetical protein
MALSPNYGFPEPDNASLVKNGAQDIRALGDAIDSFLFRPLAINGCLNSGFDIWQRGVSFTVGTATPYTADRWQAFRTGLVAGMTVTREATGDTTNLPFVQYCARVQRDSGNTSTAFLELAQSFESNQSIPFAGKQVTLSFYARKGADYSSASNVLTYRLDTGTGTDQNVVTGGYTGQAATINATATLTNTWQRFQTTATLPTTTTELAVRFRNTPVGTAGANDYFEITGVQVEAGNQMSPFTRNSGTIQGELAACMRYYEQFSSGTTGQSILCVNQALASNETLGSFSYQVTKRVAPTISSSGGTVGALNANAGAVTGTIGFTVITPYFTRVNVTGASGLVAGNASAIYYDGATLKIDAEL